MTDSIGHDDFPAASGIACLNATDTDAAAAISRSRLLVHHRDNRNEEELLLTLCNSPLAHCEGGIPDSTVTAPNGVIAEAGANGRYQQI